MKVPAADLQAQFAAIEGEIREAIDRVLESQHFILGPEVAALEQALCERLGCRHALGVSSGTDALLLALMALEIGPGDEVITTPYTFFATAGVVHRLGARPVFVDIDPASFNLDPGGVEAALTERTRALLPVHLFGRCAELAPLLALAEGHGVPLVEDAAQSIGAVYRGRAAGTLGRIGCFSFFPAKNLGAYGDAGMVVTDDDGLAERMRVLRTHGAQPKYHHHVVGGNFRMDALQGAVLRAKLGHLDRWTEARRAHARGYQARFEAAGLVGPDRPIRALPSLDALEDQVFNQYVIRTRDRDALREHLAGAGVASAVYYPIPLHRQACFKELGIAPGSLPHAERAARETLALPIHPELSAAQMDHVVDQVRAFFADREEGSGGHR